MVDKKIYAIVPARSGSRGLKNKNIMELNGHPLLAYSIQAGLLCPLVSKVICTTDSKEYGEIASKYGAEVPFMRPKNISDSMSRDIDFFDHLIKYLEKIDDLPDIFVLLRPTSPLRRRDLLSTMIKKFSSSNFDSMKTIVQAPYSPYKMWSLSGEEIKPIMRCEVKEAHDSPRQNLPEVWLQAGSIDIINLSTITDLRSVSGNKIGHFKIDSYDFCDIDTPDNFEMIKSKIEKSDYINF